MNTNDLAIALKEIATENWKDFGKPILLSGLPEKLADRLQADYKPILGSDSLKNFIKSTGPTNGYRLVEHPTQRARLGLVPAGVYFEFPTDIETTTHKETTQHDIEGFLRVLQSMTSEELLRVSLPASLLIRLLNTK